MKSVSSSVSEVYQAQASNLEHHNLPEKGRLNLFTAEFRDKALERAYGDFIEMFAWRREFLMQLAGIGAFVCYGVLDVLVVGPFTTEFLIIRLLTALLVLLYVMFSTAYGRFRRHVGATSALGVGICSMSIVFMIYRMPIEGSAPYIVGVQFSMLLSACLMRVRVALAIPMYTSVGMAYLASLLFKENVPTVEFISGVFFMWSAVIVVGVANYVQETRARIIWLRGVQRESDAAKIADLLLQATAADESKANFLSVLTHELKTPLHQIIGFSELVKNEVCQKGVTSAADASEQVVEAAQKMLSRVNQMLRYSAVSAGKLDFVIDTYYSREIIDDLVPQFTEATESRNIKLDVDGVKDVKLTIDSHHTVYALSGLIDNAIKASAEGSVVRLVGDPIGDDVFRLLIIDSGAGMSAETIDSLMSPFAQGASALSRESEGLGLGLAIAVKVFEAQKGGLTIESNVGSGTIVTVTLPMAKPKTSDDEATSDDQAA